MLSIQAKKIEGVIVFSNKTVNVTFEIQSNQLVRFMPDLASVQKGVTYYEANGEKKKLKPDAAKEIKFTINGEEFRMLSMVKDDKKLFLRILIDGNLKLFNFYETQVTGGAPGAGGFSIPSTHSSDDCLLQKGEGELKKFKKGSFKKDMIEYLSDYPELCQKIENKEYKSDNLEDIVNFYNSNCGK